MSMVDLEESVKNIGILKKYTKDEILFNAQENANPVDHSAFRRGSPFHLL